MEKFVIHGELKIDKTLAILQNSTLSQGENLSTILQIAIPKELESCVFQLEFGCPNGYCYTSQMLTPVVSEQSYIEYQIESCVLQNAGNVTIQVLTRQQVTDEILWKSTIDFKSELIVLPSINAQCQSYAKKDFFAQAYNALEKINTASENLEDMTEQINAVNDKCNQFLEEYNQKLQSGELRGQAGASVVSIVETGKDLDGNSIYTITMSDGGQFNFTVPAGKQGEKGDKGDTGLTGEYITTVFLKQTMPNGDKEYIIGTNMGKEFSFVSPKGTNGIDGETITALNHTATDESGNRTYTFVTNMGKEFSFVSLKGNKGEQGIQGEKGDKGDKGDTPILEGVHESLTAGRAIADKNGNDILNTYARLNDLKIHNNLLLNSNFAINQRQIYQHSPTPDAKYCPDRWEIYSDLEGQSTVNMGDDGISFQLHTNDSIYIRQKLERTLSEGNEYCLSIKTNGQSVQHIILTDTLDQKLDFVYGQAYYEKQQNAIEIKLFGASTGNIQWIKLETGNIPTAYAQPELDLELLRCQRYFVSFQGNGIIFGTGFTFNNLTTAKMQITLPNILRTIPTITYKDIYLISSNHASSSARLVTGQMSLTNFYNNNLCFECSSSDLTNNEFNMFQIRSKDGYIHIDAEL